MSGVSISIDMILYSMVIVIAVFTLNSCSASDELEQIKPRRGGTVGLFAFPRVGRSDPSLYSNYHAYGPSQGSFEEYDDLQKIEWKRNEGLVPFPRVGRSDSQLRKWSRLAAMQQEMDKRTPASANSGLWFGPRLGRIQKRAADAGGLSGDNRLDIYTPRLGRESDETIDDFGNIGSEKSDYVEIFNNLINYKNNHNNQHNKNNHLKSFG